MTADVLLGHQHEDSRVGARDHLLVLPSVVCAARVAQAIGEAAGGVSVTHQHGCAHVGDDVERTEAAFVGVAANPNVGGVVIVSLGCETVLGARVADRITRRRQRTELVVIQDCGGADGTVESGTRGVRRPRSQLSRERLPASPDRVTIGIAVSRETPLAEELARHALAAGAKVVLASDHDRRRHGLWRDARAVAFGAPARGPLSVVTDAGRGAQRHLAAGAAGAHVIVSFPARDEPPDGFAVCPVIAVAGESSLHRALSDDFDVREDTSVERLWRQVVDVSSGARAVAEQRQSDDFPLARLSRSM